MFKIGDKVRVFKDCYPVEKGEEGIIKALPGDNGSEFAYSHCYAIDFSLRTVGHNCNGKVPSGHGFWVEPECLELIKSKPKDEKIVITHDGKTTLARLYDGKELVKTAEAKCSPDDDFDFAVGAKLAFKRLTGEEENPRSLTKPC